jgi:transposase
MNPSAIHYLGIDVAKATLQIDDGAVSFRLANTARAIGAWLQALRDHPRSDGARMHLICEASGGYERLLVHGAHALQVAVSIVNPRAVRDFARAHGQLEKTDPLDAAILRRFGEQIRPAPTVPATAVHAQLQAWVVQRDHCVAALRQEHNRLELAPLPAIRAQIQRSCAHYQRLIAQADHQIEHLLATAAPALQACVQTLCLVEGVSVRTATSVLAHLPELGRLSEGAAAKLAGLAPLPDDSGQHHGVRYTQHGRAAVRRALYMAALVAARCNPALRAFYLRLRARGKAPKVALIAVARKLLLFLNRILKPAFDPST